MTERGRKEKADLNIVLVLIGLFLVPAFVRRMVLPSFYQVNLFGFLGCLSVLYGMLARGRMKREDFLPYLLMAVMTVLLMCSEMHAGRTAKGFVRVFSGLMMPLPLLFYRPAHPKRTIGLVVKIFIGVSVFITMMGLIDFLIGKKLITAYYLLAHDDNYYEMAADSNRLYSYVGHPLYNAEIFLITFGLNYAYNEMFLKKHKNDKWIILVTLTGVAMTASKSAIAIYLGLLAVLYCRDIRYFLFCGGVLTAGYVNHLFDSVIERFKGSLSTGRNEVWERISGSGIRFFQFFWGQGSDKKYKYSYLEEWARAAFEYPYRLFALEFGILFSAIMMFTIFFWPGYKILKDGSNRLLRFILFAAVSLHVNMYNGIGTYIDPMYLFCLFGCMILNMGRIGGGNDYEA